MPAYKGAKHHGIFRRTPIELSGDMCGSGGDGYFRQFTNPVVFEVCQDAIFPALFSRIREDIPASAVSGAGRAVKRQAFVLVGGKIDIPIGRSITGNGAQIFLEIQRERVGDHRAEAKAAAKYARGIHAQLILEQCEHVGKENVVFIITPPPGKTVGVSLGRHENDGDMIPFRIGLESIKSILHHRIHIPAHHVHGKNQPAGFVLVVIGGNVDGVFAGKTGARNRVGSAFEIPKLFAATGAGDWSVLQFTGGING